MSVDLLASNSLDRPFVRFQMNQHVSQHRVFPQELVLHRVTDAVPRFHRDLRVDFDVNVRKVFQTRFPHPKRFDTTYAIHGIGGIANGSQEFGVCLLVHQLTGTGPQQIESGPDDRCGYYEGGTFICPNELSSTPTYQTESHEYGQRTQRVSTVVPGVGDDRQGTGSLPHTDLVSIECLFDDGVCAGNPQGPDRWKFVDLMDARNGMPSDEKSGRDNQYGDIRTGNRLRPAVSIGMFRVGGKPGDAQRVQHDQGDQRVADRVDRVRDQRDRVAQYPTDQLGGPQSDIYQQPQQRRSAGLSVKRIFGGRPIHGCRLSADLEIVERTCHNVSKPIIPKTPLPRPLGSGTGVK